MQLSNYQDKICYLSFGFNKFLYLQYFIIVYPFFNTIKKKLKIPFFQLLIISFPPAVIFLKVLLNDPFFLSDDFAHLDYSYIHSYLEIANQAIFGGGIWVGHRIITGFWLFKIIFDLFGINIFPYITAVFLLNLLIVLLFFKLLKKLKISTNVSLLTTFIFGFMYLTWISNMHELLGAIFVITSILLWLSFLENKKTPIFLGSTFSYILAFLSKEITFLLAPFMILLFMTKNGRSSKYKGQLLILLIIFVMYTLFFASGFISYFGIDKSDGYRMEISLANILKNLQYYLFLLSPYKYFIFGLTVTTLLRDLVKKKLEALIYILAFFAFIAPPLLFLDRTSSYYLFLPSIFVFVAFSYVFQDVFNLLKTKFKKRLYKIAVILVTVLILVLFDTERKLMDICFLIQKPWQNELRTTLSNIDLRTPNEFEGNKYEVQLTEKEDNKLKELQGSESLKLFFTPEKQKYKLNYSGGKIILYKI